MRKPVGAVIWEDVFNGGLSAMHASVRFFGVVTLGSLISALAVSDVTAQPGVKVAPQIKPDPGKGPMLLPKAGEPGKLPPGGVVLPGPTPGKAGTPGGTVGGPTQPTTKGDPGGWPKDINGKTLEATITDIRTNADPAVREACVRALPGFGPRARELCITALNNALRDSDINVRLAATSVYPAICMAMGYLNVPDKVYEDGLATLLLVLDSEFYPARLEATAGVAAFGPYARTINNRLIARLATQSKAGSSWHLRRVALLSLATLGQGMPGPDGMRGDPDAPTVLASLESLKNDSCALVRREAVNTLIALGPVSTAQQKGWRTELDRCIRQDKDKSVVLWARVCLVRNDPAGPKANEAHLDAIAELLAAKEPGGRLEACHAMALLGEDAVSKLRELLTVVQTEKVPEIQAVAIGALVNMRSQAAAIIPMLQQVVANPLTNENVKKVATEAITELSKKAPAPMVLPMKK